MMVTVEKLGCYRNDIGMYNKILYAFLESAENSFYTKVLYLMYNLFYYLFIY